MKYNNIFGNKMRNIVIIILFILTVFNLILNSHRYLNRPNNQKPVPIDFSLAFHNLYLQVITNDFIIKNISVLSQDGEMTFKEILSNKPSLIVYFSENNCRQCVDSVLSYVFTLKNAIEKNRVIGIANYLDMRELMLFRDYYKIPFEVYCTIDNSIEKELVIENVPFLFVVDSTLRTRSLFIPDKSHPKYTKTYIEAINHYFSKR